MRRWNTSQMSPFDTPHFASDFFKYYFMCVQIVWSKVSILKMCKSIAKEVVTCNIYCMFFMIPRSGADLEGAPPVQALQFLQKQGRGHLSRDSAPNCLWASSHHHFSSKYVLMPPLLKIPGSASGNSEFLIYMSYNTAM